MAALPPSLMSSALMPSGPQAFLDASFVTINSMSCAEGGLAPRWFRLSVAWMLGAICGALSAMYILVQKSSNSNHSLLERCIVWRRLIASLYLWMSYHAPFIDRVASSSLLCSISRFLYVLTSRRYWFLSEFLSTSASSASTLASTLVLYSMCASCTCCPSRTRWGGRASRRLLV